MRYFLSTFFENVFYQYSIPGYEISGNNHNFHHQKKEECLFSTTSSSFSSSYNSAMRIPVSVWKISQISRAVRNFFILYNYSNILCPGLAKFIRALRYDLSPQILLLLLAQMIHVLHLSCLLHICSGPSTRKIMRKIQCHCPHFLETYNLFKQICNHDV